LSIKLDEKNPVSSARAVMASTMGPSRRIARRWAVGDAAHARSRSARGRAEGRARFARTGLTADGRAATRLRSGDVIAEVNRQPSNPWTNCAVATETVGRQAGAAADQSAGRRHLRDGSVAKG